MNYWILKNCWNHQIRNNEIFLDVKKAELTGISLLNDILSGERFPKWPLFFVFWTTVIIGIPNDRYLYQNDHYIYKKMTIILGSQWCWWHRYVADIVMLVTILRCWWHNKDARDMPIGHQHNYMHECDVGDRLIMLKT